MSFEASDQRITLTPEQAADLDERIPGWRSMSVGQFKEALKDDVARLVAEWDQAKAEWDVRTPGWRQAAEGGLQ